jgi:hypothetical protein
MEVDSSAVEERKEGGGDALLTEGQSSYASLADFSQPEQPGQQQIGKGCPTLSKLEPVLIDALGSTVWLCVGLVVVPVCTGRPRMDGKHQLCELFSARLSRVKNHRAHGKGRVCHPRCKPPRIAAPAAPVVPLPDPMPAADAGPLAAVPATGKQSHSPQLQLLTLASWSFSKHGLEFAAPSRASCALSASLVVLAKDLEDWRPMRGCRPSKEATMLRTLGCKEADIRRIRAVGAMQALCTQQLRAFGKDPSRYRLVVMTVMVADQGYGRGPVHFDLSKLAI